MCTNLDSSTQQPAVYKYRGAVLVRITVETLRWIRWSWRRQVVGHAAVSLSQLAAQPPEGMPVRDWRKRGLLWFLADCDSLFFTAVHQSVSLSEMSRGGWLRPRDPLRLLFGGRISLRRRSGEVALWSGGGRRRLQVVVGRRGCFWRLTDDCGVTEPVSWLTRKRMTSCFHSQLSG